MAGVKSFYQSKCSHELLVTFTRSISQVIAKHTDDLFIGRQSKTLEALMDEMNSAFQRNRASSFTEKRSELDARRDAIAVAIRSALNAAIDQEFLNKSRANAAIIVKTAMDKMPANVIYLGYNQESAHLRAFLAACLEMGDIVTTAGVLQLVQALQETQDEFDATNAEKVDSEEVEVKVRQIISIRKDINRRLHGLFGYLDLNATDLTEEFGETVTGINALIGEVMAKAKADQTRSDTTAL